MANIEITPDGRIRLTTAWMEKDLVNQVPGTRFNYNDECWYLALSWGAACALRGVFGSNLEVGPALTAWAAKEFSTRIQPAMALRHRMTTDAPDMDERLYDFQKVGVEFLVGAKRALLADEMGTGKTVQTIIALKEQLAERDSSKGPILIVCPNSMTGTWKREFATWWDEALAVEVLTGNITQRRKMLDEVKNGTVDVLITNWEKLRLHSRLAPYGSVALKRCQVCEPTAPGRQTNCEKCEKEMNDIPWSAIVADEAHRMKNPRAKQTRALWWISRDVDIKYALTGTPIANRPDDLWSIMHFVAPEDWPSKGSFIDRYCLVSWNPWGGTDIVGIRPQTKDEFFQILDPRFIRRTKAMVLPELPPKVYVRRDIDLTPKQKKAYKQIVDTMLAELDGGIAAVTNPLVRMTRLLQLTSAFAEVDGDGNWSLVKPSPKIDALLEIIEEAGTQQIAVFAESRQLIVLAEQTLTEKDVKFASIHGGISQAERDVAITRLNDGDVQVLLLTLGAGGEGLTLTAADIIVFLERSYSMIKNLQAEDRLHRIGQTADHVEIIDVIAADTLDEQRLAVRDGKAQKLEEIVRDAASLRAMLEGQ